MVMGDLDEMRMSSVQEFENEFGNTLRFRQETDQLGDTGQQFLLAARQVNQGIEEDSDMESERRNFASAPINSKSALRGNQALRERHEALQEELAAQGYRANEKEKKAIVRSIKKHQQLVDSDDFDEDYTSSVWGDGTSKLVAHHYKTLQNKKAPKEDDKDNKEALTVTDFLDISNKLAKTRQEKKAAKTSGL